jgi:hypothetical protein
MVSWKGKINKYENHCKKNKKKLKTLKNARRNEKPKEKKQGTEKKKTKGQVKIKLAITSENEKIWVILRNK